MTTKDGRSEAMVRLTVTRFEVADAVHGEREVLLDVDVPADELGITAVLWLEREVGDESLSKDLQQRFIGDEPRDGFRAVLNKPHGLAFVATWPGAELPLELRLVSARES